MQTQLQRYALAALLGFLALNAFAGGYYALSGAAGVPVEWLAGSGFSSYVFPGVILIVVVGGSALVAAIAVLSGNGRGDDLAKLAGWILVVWLVAQVAIIGFVSWMQPATATAAVAILWLAYRPRIASRRSRYAP